MFPLSTKAKVKLVLIAVLTALIGGAMLATGSGAPEAVATTSVR
ncbi:hypothetical protein [Actinomadura rubrisoli]|nr:hypothetical protein [Actinomadura rubrisoli]